jgi:hypothetical protein
MNAATCSDACYEFRNNSAADRADNYFQFRDVSEREVDVHSCEYPMTTGLTRERGASQMFLTFS